MPQIGWLEILFLVIISILVLGPKEFPIALKKIGSYVGKIKNTIISFQKEISSTTEKIEKFSPGKHIPVVPMSHFKDNIPDIAFLFAWNHKEEIFLKEKEFKKNGGTWFSHVAL